LFHGSIGSQLPIGQDPKQMLLKTEQQQDKAQSLQKVQWPNRSIFVLFYLTLKSPFHV
jgi:hypothetical protein